MRVFLSYRRADVGGYSGRLADSLAQHLGARNVFRDVTDIAAGRDFDKTLREALNDCDAAVAVIGPGWLSARTAEGRTRLFEPDDYVRLELATALLRDLPVAPVLVGGAALPGAADLPEDLRSLAKRQAIVLHDETWHQDVENLLRSLQGRRAGATPRSKRRLTTAVVVLGVVIGLLWWQPWRTGSSGGGKPSASPLATSAVSPTCPSPTGGGWTPLTLGQDLTAEEQFESGPVVYTVRMASWRTVEPGRWQVVVDTSVANEQTASFFTNPASHFPGIVVGQEFKLSCLEATIQELRPGARGEVRSGYVVACPPNGRVALIVGNGGTRLPITDAPDPSVC